MALFRCNVLKNLPIRYKLLIYYSIVFTLSICLGSIYTYAVVRKTITRNLEGELENTTQALLNMVKTAVDVSIKNHLRAIAEKNREIASYYYRKYEAGEISEDQAKQMTAALLLNQTIGKSGYTYCLDSNGVVLIHPEKELINVNVSEHAFVRQQRQLKEGYLEYQWKNPGETEFRPKALYMTYFAPWDWIISVSSYRKEFKHVVNVDDFKERILDIRFGETGYSFVLDSTGTAIIHPKIPEVNIFSEQSLPDEYVAAMLERKKGKITYFWKNPNESRRREKLVIFNYLPEYEWIVASSGYLEEFYRPLVMIQNIFLSTVLFTLALITPLTLIISANITNPLKKLMDHFHQTGETGFSVRMRYKSRDELGQLVAYYNDFMEQLEIYSNNLNDEIRRRERIEVALRESEGRYRSVMDATPDPIVVYNMVGEVIFFNPAFTRVFGWTLEESIGRKMDHFVPEENWPETWQMIRAIQAGETLTLVETCRFNKKNRIIPVTISGASYRGLDGRLAGSVIILRDITRTKRLRKQIMDIADRERQKFGQDLHDDLGPHLIGIQGLCAVLHANLREDASRQVQLAEKILILIGDAIHKSKSLARGLCPVHLVSRGLFSALQDLAERTTDIAGIPCDFETDKPFDITDNIEATNLYFIIQEAVTNAVNHSRATHIVIRTYLDANTVRLWITDNGCGFDRNAVATGIGLQIMEYRAKMIGAALQVDSHMNQGTTVRVLMKNHPASLQ